jgi:hypothetical protein
MFIYSNYLHKQADWTYDFRKANNCKLSYTKSDNRNHFTEENNVHSVCRTQNTNVQPKIREVRNNIQHQVSLIPSAFTLTIEIISVGGTSINW